MVVSKKDIRIFLVSTLLILTNVVYCINAEWVWDSGYRMVFPNESNANMLLWIACIILTIWAFCYIPQIKYFSRLVQIIVFVIVSISTAWMLITLTGNNTIFTIFVRQYSPYMFVFAIVLVLGRDSYTFNRCISISKYVMLGALLLTIYQELAFMLTYGFTMRSQSSAIHVFYWDGIMSWLFWIFNTDSRENVVVAKIGTALLVVAAFLSSSRSNILISLLCVFLFYRRNSEYKKIKIGAYVRLAITALIAIILFNHFVPEMYNSMLDRLFSDSRGGQIEVFFQQVSFLDLLIGKGAGATYSFSRFQNFAYVDNANIVMMFRYGMLPTIGMLALFCMAVGKSWLYHKNRSWQIVFIWLLVTNGFSVYLNYKITWGYFLLWLTVGHILNNEREKNEYNKI